MPKRLGSEGYSIEESFRSSLHRLQDRHIGVFWDPKSPSAKGVYCSHLHVTSEANMTPKHSKPRAIVMATVVLGWIATPSVAQLSAQDYPQWRGQTRDGSASAFSPPRTWP